MAERKTNEYLRSDLAIESYSDAKCKDYGGVSVKEYSQGEICISSVEITDEEGEKALGKPCGKYITLSFGRLWEEDEAENSPLVESIESAIREVFENPTQDSVFLVVGLGNRNITADSLGPLVCDSLSATSHIKKEGFSLNGAAIATVVPGVLGRTGIESFELVYAAAQAASATHIIAIDSLAARSIDRLSRTVQLANTGIIPGSGVGNHRSAINKKTLGVPVVAIGVPGIVSSATLIYEALEKSGYTEITASLEELLENNKSFFVTVKDCDKATEYLAKAIAAAIRRYAASI